MQSFKVFYCICKSAWLSVWSVICQAVALPEIPGFFALSVVALSIAVFGAGLAHVSKIHRPPVRWELPVSSLSDGLFNLSAVQSQRFS